MSVSEHHYSVVGVQNSPARVPVTAPPPEVVQNMHMSFAPPPMAANPPYSASAEGSSGGSGAGFNGLLEPMKRKRGRPRKYGPDGSMAMGLNAPVPVAAAASPVAAGAPAVGQDVGVGPASPNSMKKARGRPPGSSKKQQIDNFGSTGFGFTPHIIAVKAGEDVAHKIMSFSQNGPRAICILSASGTISNVTLRQPATFGGTATYEERFDILSLTGSFMPSEIGGHQSRKGGLSVKLAGSDGRILGGGVAGVLTAASPVQVIVASFIADGRKEPKSANHFEASPAPLNANLGGMTGANSPPSRGTSSESSGGQGSPLNHSGPVCTNNNLQGMSSMPWK
ncbi:AT-hook motif nuclear-localized protein 10-like [Capsicum annuum]|nr:AT-hook motif nuclear-localized protein 10-like [Capsicum annuum]